MRFFSAATAHPVGQQVDLPAQPRPYRPANLSFLDTGPSSMDILSTE
jgi:hypothetical protein